MLSRVLGSKSAILILAAMAVSLGACAAMPADSGGSKAKGGHPDDGNLPPPTPAAGPGDMMAAEPMTNAPPGVDPRLPSVPGPTTPIAAPPGTGVPTLPPTPTAPPVTPAPTPTPTPMPAPTPPVDPCADYLGSWKATIGPQGQVSIMSPLLMGQFPLTGDISFTITPGPAPNTANFQGMMNVVARGAFLGGDLPVNNPLSATTIMCTGGININGMQMFPVVGPVTFQVQGMLDKSHQPFSGSGQFNVATGPGAQTPFQATGDVTFVKLQ
jgi:hypothetical protein